MNKFLSCVLLLSLITLVLMPVACARPKPPPRPQVEYDVVYGKGYMASEDDAAPTLQPLLMDIIRPGKATHSPRPAVLLIHGGGFERGSKDDEQQVALAKTLAGNGYVCFLINYRLVRDHPPAPMPYEDVLSRAAHASVVDAKTALRHVCARAADYGIDPKRVALLGSSAGAIAALGAGLSAPERFTSDGDAFPMPPENLPNTAARAAAIVNLWGTADMFPELFSAKGPPIMTVHGAKDFRVGLSLLPAENIDAQCKRYGIPHRYYPLPEAGHGAWDAVVDGKPLATLIVEFLDEYVKP